MNNEELQELKDRLEAWKSWLRDIPSVDIEGLAYITLAKVYVKDISKLIEVVEELQKD